VHRCQRVEHTKTHRQYDTCQEKVNLGPQGCCRASCALLAYPFQAVVLGLRLRLNGIIRGRHPLRTKDLPKDEGPTAQQSVVTLTRIITYTLNHERVEIAQALSGYSSKSPTTSLKSSCKLKVPSSATQASTVLKRNTAYKQRISEQRKPMKSRMYEPAPLHRQCDDP
jgi:hypothetical protein